jgi:hypothetical protein
MVKENGSFISDKAGGSPGDILFFSDLFSKAKIEALLSLRILSERFYDGSTAMNFLNYSGAIEVD